MQPASWRPADFLVIRLVLGATALPGLLFLYAAVGAAIFLIDSRLSLAVEPAPQELPQGAGAERSGLRRSRSVVYRLTALFGADALAGGLVVQGILVLWFHERYGLGAGTLGPLFFITSLAAAGSFLLAAPLAQRWGLLNTMVFTHLPSNILLLLVPLAPSFPVAAALLIARSLLSWLDVPTR